MTNEKPNPNNTAYEAVIFNRFEVDGETKWDCRFINNLRPKDDGSFDLYIPDGLAVSGRLVIQPKQPKEDQDIDPS